MERGGPPSGRCFCDLLVVVSDQRVDQDDSLAAVRLFLASPVGAARTRVAAARPPAGEGEIVQERDVVVLSADGTGGDRKLRVALIHAIRRMVVLDLIVAFGRIVRSPPAVVPPRVVVFGRKPQVRLARILRERYDRPADAADEAMHDGAQEWPAFAAGRGPEPQSSEDLRLGNRPPDPGRQGWG